MNGLNQYTSIDGASPIYDGNGNLTTDHQGRSFSFDAENVMRSASGLTGGSATYRYHADGSRRQKTHNGSTSTFYYMGGLGYLDEADTAFAADQEMAEYSGAGALQKRFVRLPGSIDEAFLMIDVSSGSAVETWAHTNRQGSVIAITDSTGATNSTYRYSPYGTPGSEGPNGFPFRYTGQRLDPETGLYYYKARYYDPETGRFLQTDPIGYGDGMNMYAYVGNDPMNNMDPTGRSLCNGPCNFGGPPKPVSIDEIQSSLDVAGFAGPVGPFADVTNAVISLFRGNFTDAGVSAIAIVPILGDGIKGSRMATKALDSVPNGATRRTQRQEIPTPDHTGRIHTDIPSHVPNNWSVGEVDDAIAQVRRSITQRKRDIRRHGANDRLPGHHERLRREEDWLKSLEKARSGMGDY